MLESDSIFGTYRQISPLSGPGKCCELTYSNKNSKLTDHHRFQKFNLPERPEAPVLKDMKLKFSEGSVYHFFFLFHTIFRV